MHVGVEEAVAQRMAQEGLDHRARQMLEIEALGLQRGAVVQRRAVDPFERQHVLGGAVPVDRRHAEVRIGLGVLRHLGQRGGLQPQIHFQRDRAAQAWRRSRPCRSRRASAEMFSAWRAAKVKASRSTRKRRSTCGRSTFTATALRPSGVVDLGAMHLRDRGRRDRRAEHARRPRAAAGRARPATTASASACGNGAILSCSYSRSRASATPTTSGRVARNWPSLT